MLSRKSPSDVSQAVERNCRGSVLPLVTVALFVAVAFTGFVVDVMRTALAVRKLQFAAQSAALYGYSYATNQDGSYLDATARSNITDKVLQACDVSNAFNTAPAGPDDTGLMWESPVSLGTDDVVFVPNPDDSAEIFLQVTARRAGTDALKLFFLPAIFAMNGLLGEPVPEGIGQASPYRTVEVIGQVASRIGSGAPKSADSGTRAGDLVGFAVFPLAISNRQFKEASDRSQTRSTYVVDLPTSSSYVEPIEVGHLRGALINVAYSANSSRYYGETQGNTAIDELIGLCNYFVSGTEANVLPPAPMERGSLVGAFDPLDSVFSQRRTEIVTAFSQLPVNKHYIVPVMRDDPNFSADNQVVGFARFKLISVVNSSGSDFSFVVEIADSVPVRNASSGNGLAAVPAVSGAVIPAPEDPFCERKLDPLSGSVTPRPRGVVLAPALSPRILPNVS